MDSVLMEERVESKWYFVIVELSVNTESSKRRKNEPM